MKMFVFNAVLIVTVSVFTGEISGNCESLEPECKKGFQRDPDDCNLFCQCAHQRWYPRRCPTGLYWDEKVSTCNWPKNVPDCSPPQGLCTVNPCRNGGTCRSERMGYACDCPPGFGGRDCSMVQDPCSENSCMNGGQCRRIGQASFTCDCPPNFTGRFCQDTNCQRYECPGNVTSFNYPDWQDQTCTSYFECRLGRLRRRECQRNTVFSAMDLRCVDPNELELPCTLYFVDSVVQ